MSPPSQSLLRLLRPFERDYYRYLAGIVVRQGLIVASGYSMVLAIRLCAQKAGIPEWVFVTAFLLFDAGLLTLDAGLNYFFSSRLGYPLFGKLRTAALAKVFEMPIEWHQKKDSGRLAGEVNTGVGKVVQTAEGISRELIPAMLRTVLSLVPLFWVSPLTAPAALLALAVFMAISVVENRKRAPYRRSRYQNYNKDYGLFAECVQQVRPVVQFGQQQRLLGVYGQVQRAIEAQGIEETRVGNQYSWPRNLVLSATKRVCQGIWLYQYNHNALDIAMVMYLSMLLEDLLNSYWGYASLLERIYDGVEPVKILVKLLDEKPSIADSPDATRQPVPEKVGVRLVNVAFSYTGRDSVISNFDLAIEPGTVLGIVGRSGGGKTTLHNLLSRMFDIEQGFIEISGQDIRRWPLSQLRSLFSYVTHDSGVFFSEMTIADTIRFPRPDAGMREVIEAAVCACIHDDIMKLPMKYKTRLGERGMTLSKGQQQRIAMAQALVALNEDKKVLILDEFTSALDSETERRLLTNIKPHLTGKTVIVIAHRLSTLRSIADQIVVVENGRVKERGSHAELIERGGWYAEMARIQAVA